MKGKQESSRSRKPVRVVTDTPDRILGAVQGQRQFRRLA